MKLVSPTIPQHIYIFRIVLLSPIRFSEHFQKIGPKIGENWWKLVKISEIGITYNTPTYIYFWNRLVEPVKIFLVKSPPIWNFTTLPDAASLLHPCDARTSCGGLRLLFFYRTVNSFLTMNSLLTVNSMVHTLWLCLIWHTHYVWRPPLFLFLSYRELFSDRELFTNCELHDAHTSALPHMMHALHVANSACSFSIVPWTLFWPWTLYWP